jgi:SAM-dependent methyltransferase
MSKYDTELDPANANTSHAQILELVGGNKRVLDIGCATGYLARALVAQGCTVSGVEYEADAAEQARPTLDRLLVGDLEELDLVEFFGRDQFDALVFGDVLEHLRDPLAVLRKARPLLARGGCLGLLDTTHLRFFTLASLREMLREAGLAAVEVRRTIADIFETELAIKPEDYDPELIEEVRADPESTTYQFVVRGVADDADQAVHELQGREEEQRVTIREREVTIRQLEGTIAELKAEVERLTAELAALRAVPPPPPPPPKRRALPIRMVAAAMRAALS